MSKTIKRIGILVILGIFISASLPFRMGSVCADEADLFTISVPPNVLFILDNSNSMDEDFVGNCVCSWATGSRSVEGKKALISLVNTYVNKMRIGLMTYELPSASKWRLHNCVYFASYEPKCYCPNQPPECEEWCKTGDGTAKAACEAACQADNPSFDADYMDEIIPHFPTGSEQRNRYCSLCYPKTNRYVNPTDTSHYVYYKKPGTLYASSNYGTKFGYSSSYNPDEGNTDSYALYSTKTGTSDELNGFSNYWTTCGFYPTDEDWALGFGDFGGRLAWYYTGRTWFANSSPGGGYLHINCNDNNEANDNQKNALLDKLEPYENDETGYMSCTNTGNPNNCDYIVNAGLTPTAGTLQSAIDYFNGTGSYSSPVQYWCQKTFVVYVTDGLPSVGEGGASGSADALMPAVLTKLDNLRNFSKTLGGTSYDFDVKTYIIGLGLTTEAKAKLDEMAVHGGTATNGHAYYADDTEELISGLNLILQDIIEQIYSFSTASVQSSRVADENFIYQASFEPAGDNPFWHGHLKKYTLEEDGNVGSAQWDAGLKLQSKAAAGRTIKTYKAGSVIDFTIANLAKEDLEAPTDDERDAIVGYIRGEAAHNPDNWKLGDIYRSDPVTIGSLSAYFHDAIDKSGPPNAFAQFMTNNERTSANGKRMIAAGANDGQIHAFRTSDGEEMWSFIPPNLLPQLKEIAHSSNPSGQNHTCFVDGPVMAADVWLGAGDGTNKSASDWKTRMIFGEGRGGAERLWSSSPTFESGCTFNLNYSTNYPNYCGYYCFDVTDTLNPVYKWRINPTPSDAPYLGDPWCKIRMGRVKIDGSEKWAGFMGGGYKEDAEASDRGKGFYVIDLSNGDILWSYTHADNGDMDYSIPAPAAIVDTDNDGFIDVAYVADLGGNMWRFTFCTKADTIDEEGETINCGTAHWDGSLLFHASSGVIRPIYTSAAVAKDENGNLWVYWGTGDKTDPTAANAQEKFYALKDNDRTTTYGISDLENITTGTYSDSSDKHGWYINFAGSGEKVLAEPTVFGGVVYFTTYTPYQGGDPCETGGDAKFYAVDYVTGGGKLDEDARSMDIGSGMPSAPIISLKPGNELSVDIYVTTSGGGGSGAQVQKIPNYNAPTLSNRTNMLFWKDQRLQ